MCAGSIAVILSSSVLCCMGFADECHSAAPATATQAVPMNPELVAFVFKEVLSKFHIYKKSPHKFEGLVNDLSSRHKLANVVQLLPIV